MSEEETSDWVVSHARSAAVRRTVKRSFDRARSTRVLSVVEWMTGA